MRDIARLLFGDDADGLLNLFGRDDAEAAGMADRVRQAEEWCGSTPGGDSAPDAVRGVIRPHGFPRRPIRPW